MSPPSFRSSKAPGDVSAAGRAATRSPNRRWYERQLFENHAYLVTAFLSLILLLAGFEAMDELRGSTVYYLAVVAVAAATGTLMWVAWQRFCVPLVRAELFAESAGCPCCQAWGRFDVLAAEETGGGDPPEAGRPHWLRVRCRRCGEQWRLG